MNKPVDQVRNMVMEHQGVIAIIEHLRQRDDFVLTPFNFLRILGEAFSMPLTDSRSILAFFDLKMHPLASIEEIESHSEILFSRYRGQ